MTKSKEPVRLAGAELHHHCHACAFFHSRDEEYRLLLPFAKEGYEKGDHVFHIVDPDQRQDRLQRFQKAGIDMKAAERTGQVEVPAWEEVHLREGRFDQDAMLTLVEEVFQRGQARGFGLTRFWANMEWSLRDSPGVEQLVEYESRLNNLVDRYDDVVICTYDLNRFGGRIVMDILRTHPQVIIGGTLHENPFFVPPDQFLQELRERTTPAEVN
jgi:hypothetical protein